MASSRVQFALERTLPDITSQAYTSLFTPDELRSITHSRTKREATLHRRGLTEYDVQSYAAYEVQLEHLRRLRQSRGERDGTVEPLEPSLRASTRRAYLSRVISIYERGLKRRPEHLSTWRSYMKWASSEKMRVVLGRIMSRALGLHNQVPALWIECAEYESKSGEVNKVRALLQRGIAICKLPTAITGKHAVGEDAQDRPSKKARLLTGSSSSSSSTVASRSSDVLVSDRELSLLSLWIEYLRFELVFLEKLRRRWEVLGLSVTGKASNGAAASKGEEEAIKEIVVDVEEGEAQEHEDEQAVVAAVPVGEEGEATSSTPNGPSTSTSSTSNASLAPLLNGAIPLSILRSSLTSLPCTSHILFLLSSLSLLHSFPFLRSSLNPSPRESLIDEVLELLRDGEMGKKLKDVCATICASQPLMQLYEREILGLDEEEEEESVGHHDSNEEDDENDNNAQELESSSALKELGALRHPSIPDRLLQEARTLLVPGSGSTKVEALDFVQHRLTSALKDLVVDSPHSDGRPLDLPSVVRELVMRMREEVKSHAEKSDVEMEDKRKLYRAELSVILRLRGIISDLSSISSSSQDEESDGEEKEASVPSRVCKALESYLSAIALQRVSLARKDDILDASLEKIAVQLALEELGSLSQLKSQSDTDTDTDTTIRTKLLKLHHRCEEVLKRMGSTRTSTLTLTEKDAEDVVELLVLGMRAFEMAHTLRDSRQDREEDGEEEEDVIEKEWQKAFKHPALLSLGSRNGGKSGKTDNVELWRAYLESLTLRRQGAKRDGGKTFEKRLEEAVRTTRTSPNAHQVVLRTYLEAGAETDAEGSMGGGGKTTEERIRFLLRHGHPSTSLLRRMIQVIPASSSSLPTTNNSKSTSDSLHDQLFTLLLSRPDARPSDALQWAQHLMSIGQSQRAMRIVSGKERGAVSSAYSRTGTGAGTGAEGGVVGEGERGEDWMMQVQKGWMEWVERQ